jgi:hypothetical protein
VTGRPKTPGRPLAELLAGLSDEHRLALLNRVGVGLFHARHAAECVTAAGSRRHETHLQLLTYLSEAIRELEAARALVAAAAEGGGAG